MKLKALKEQSGRIFEAEKKDGKISFPVIIISQGLGNLGDRNYYSAEAIQQAAADGIYEGKKAYYDHPTQEEEETRPNRSVRETCGHYEDTKAVKDEDGMWVIRANFIPEPDSPIIAKMAHAVEFKKKYPDKDYMGISINGNGEGEQMDYDDFIESVKPSEFEMKKISQCVGEQINVIRKLTDAFSADIVTEAGARGRVLLEQATKFKKGRNMIEQMKKLWAGIGAGNKKLVEEAVEGLMKQEEDEAKKEAEEKAKKEAIEACLADVKKEMKKEAAETEEEYEAKCMAEAVKRHEAAAQAPAKDDEKADDADAEEKEADDKHDDEKQDIALIKKMMGEMEEMKKEIESLKGAKQEAEAEAKKHHEEAAKSKTILQEKERNEKIEAVLSECGLPYRVTKELRPVLEKCKSVEEMKETAKRMKESFSKVVESAFINTTDSGFPEKTIEGDNKNNDLYF